MFIYAILVLCLVLYILSDIIPKLIFNHLSKVFEAEITFSNFFIYPLAFSDVKIAKNGVNVHINKICLQSRLFNSDVTKLISLKILDVRVNKSVSSSTPDGQNVERDQRSHQVRKPKKHLDFRDMKVPSRLIDFAEFMSVYVQNISVVVKNQDVSPNWFLHATAKELKLNGHVLHSARNLVLTGALCEAQAKLLRYDPHQPQPAGVSRPCMSEVHFGITLEGIVSTHPVTVVEGIELVMNNTKIVIHDGLYDFIKETKKPRHIEHVLQALDETNTFEENDAKKCYIEIYRRLSPIIPKNVLIKIENAQLSAVRENAVDDFVAKLQLLAINSKIHYNFATDELSALYIGTKINNFEIDTKYEKLLFMELFTIDSNIMDHVANLYVALNTFQLIYNHREVFGWVKNNLFSNDYGISSSKILQQVSRKTHKKSDFLEWLHTRIKVNGCAEMSNISVLVKLDEQTSSVSVSHTKLRLEQNSQYVKRPYYSNALNMLLKQTFSIELMIESLWWSLDSSTARSTTLKKTHMRGSPFYLGVGLIKITDSYNTQQKLDFTFHTLRGEYSKSLASFLVQLKECITDYTSRFEAKKPLPKLSVVVSREEQQVETPVYLVNAQLEDVSLFMFNKHETCALIRLSSLNTSIAKKDYYKIIVNNFQAAISSQLPNSSIKFSEFTETFCSISKIEADYDMNGSLQFNFINDTRVMWNPNMHMHLLTIVRDFKELKQKIGSNKPPPPANVVESPSAIKKFIKNLQISLSAEEDIVISLKLSERHDVELYLEHCFISYDQTMIKNFLINIDGAHTFTITEIYVVPAASNEDVTKERQHCENFQDATNRIWQIAIESIKGIFPYNHDFAGAIQGEFVSTYKWIKAVHGIKKKEFTSSSPLPRDLSIEINEFLLEVSDDPFEVKLRDNYVLLVDEYHESLKRKQLFDKKIAELCSERLLLPAGTIEELHANLIKKNSEIYIQRSKKIKKGGPTRTRLLAWIMTDLKIVAMADKSIHGKDNVVRMMQEIDCDSPWPEEGLDFVTLWCRSVDVSCSEWKFMLRDFPQPMFRVKQMHLFGTLCGAEQVAPPRAKREVSIDVGHPFGVDNIQRGMTSLKFYHDFNCELDLCSYAFGPCWEPVMAQCNLAFEKVSTPSRDPSPVMPFWDKMRLLLHGRLTMIVKQFTVLLHASLDPYNTTEEMEVSWYNCGIVWTNAKIMFKGNLNVSARTASRYDDCRLLDIPNLKLTFKLKWICLANPNDHHSVIPCAPDKLPEYSSNQVHDSFRAFRSQNLNIWISFETKPTPNNSPDLGIKPSLVLYGSTLRWFESLKNILSGVTRPTRRGPVFNNVRPRKRQLSRHYKTAHLQMSLHEFQVLYWLSHARHKGFELIGDRVSFSSEHILTLVPIDDGLIHRPRSEWSTIYMNCELNNAEIWLKSILTEKVDISSENINSADLKIVKFYFISVAKVSYGRETLLKASDQKTRERDTPIHKLVVYDLKGAWTKSNRDVAFTLFDSFMKAQKLKKNLSTEALKGFRKEGTSSTPRKSRRTHDGTSTPVTPSAQMLPTSSAASQSALHKQSQTSHAAAMLQQLVAEADHKFNVYSDDLSTNTSQEQQLQGLRAFKNDDVIQDNWCISLVNSQVLLKGTETSGYVILSAAKTEIWQRVHRPVWRDRSLVSKTTWIGFLECMQYYATVSAGENDSLLDENIMWLTVDNIQEKDNDAVIKELPDLPHLVGSGQSVGGVVSETVGCTGLAIGETQPIQLQRIVSRCKCEFFYVSYGETSIDPNTLTEVPPPPSEETLSPWERQDDPVDAFTLMHHDLDVCTNSLQYAMILDIVNNLMLYVEPQRKQALEKLATMRFQLQLYSSEDQKRPIQHLQTLIRSMNSRIRSLEKDIHLIEKAQAEEGDSPELHQEWEEVQRHIKECKEILGIQSDELDMMLSCYKETQLSAMNKLATVRQDKPVTIVRANEICFKHAQWRLTEADGQIGIADLILSNFLYTKKSKSDDSVEHLLELGYIRMNNLIPRDIYREVLCPTEIQKDMPVDHQRVLRVFCREKPPVGGISVKEHFEINVVPITIAITKKFYSTMLKFCFPDRDPADADAENDVDDTAGSTASLKSTSSKKAAKGKKAGKDSEFYVKIEKDDVEKMKERAEKNKLFIFIKIPEVPVRVSYKGNNKKNLEDIADFSLVIPTLEYHNVTWTWLDLLLAMQSDSRRVILSQAIKQKLQINRHKPLTSMGEQPSPQEEDKAKMLFGNRLSNENKSQRKGVFRFKQE